MKTMGLVVSLVIGLSIGSSPVHAQASMASVSGPQECQGCQIRYPGPEWYCYFGTDGLNCITSTYTCTTWGSCGLGARYRSPESQVAPDGTPVLLLASNENATGLPALWVDCQGVILRQEWPREVAIEARMRSRALIL